MLSLPCHGPLTATKYRGIVKGGFLATLSRRWRPSIGELYGSKRERERDYAQNMARDPASSWPWADPNVAFEL